MKPRNLSRAALLVVLLTAVLASSLFVSSAQLGVVSTTTTTSSASPFPKEFDVRGPDGVPKGTALRAPSPARHRALFRFTQADLDSLRLKSRATLPEGVTILLFEQTVRGLPVYNGGV